MNLVDYLTYQERYRTWVDPSLPRRNVSSYIMQRRIDLEAKIQWREYEEAREAMRRQLASRREQDMTRYTVVAVVAGLKRLARQAKELQVSQRDLKRADKPRVAFDLAPYIFLTSSQSLLDFARLSGWVYSAINPTYETTTTREKFGGDVTFEDEGNVKTMTKTQRVLASFDMVPQQLEKVFAYRPEEDFVFSFGVVLDDLIALLDTLPDGDVRIEYRPMSSSVLLISQRNRCRLAAIDSSNHPYLL